MEAVSLLDEMVPVRAALSALQTQAIKESVMALRDLTINRAVEPMMTAPKDRDIYVLGPQGLKLAYYLCCEWLRSDGDDIPDCWRPVDGDADDIELHEARGWMEPKTS